MSLADVHDVKVDLVTVTGVGLRYDVRCSTCGWESPQWHSSSAHAERDRQAHIADVEAHA